MAGFIDIACNFTHESFKENLDAIISNAECFFISLKFNSVKLNGN